jgi:hypothetical protein
MAAYKHTKRSATDRERLVRAAQKARTALLDFWTEYTDAMGGPDRITSTHRGRTTLQVFQSVNSALASIERQGVGGVQ